MNWFVYMILCHDGTLYTGISTDVARRFKEHAAQGKKCAKYLRGKSPLQLVFQQSVGSRADASKVEYQIKKLSKSQKDDLIRLSKAQ